MSNKINKQQLVLEFVSVVFAVVLALILNGWRESSALNDSFNKVKASIKKEAIRNDSLVQVSHTYRKQLLQSFYNGENMMLKDSLSSLDFDVNDNKALENFFRKALIFGGKRFYERVLVVQEGTERVLILDKSVFEIVVTEDHLILYGVGNIRLNVPDLSNRSWDLAQATGTIVKMDIALVEQLSIVNALIETYNKSIDNALQMVYNGDQNGLVAVNEDLFNIEQKIIKANQQLLDFIE